MTGHLVKTSDVFGYLAIMNIHLVRNRIFNLLCDGVQDVLELKLKVGVGTDDVHNHVPLVFGPSLIVKYSLPAFPSRHH
jgi:hypothetical protein